MKRKRMLSALLVVAMAATMFAGCGNKGGSNSSTQGGKAANDGDIKEFTAFFAVPGSEINDTGSSAPEIIKIGRSRGTSDAHSLRDASLAIAKRSL